MLLYLVRHGETQHNRDGLGLGRDDVPLTELGQAQARELGQKMSKLRLDRVFASPLQRAFDTAAAVAAPHSLTVEKRDDLLEMDVGESDGMPFAAVRARWPEFSAQWLSPEVADAAMPGGESLRQVGARLESLIAELHAMAADEAVALVTHNFVIKVLLCSLLGLDLASFRAFDVSLASVTTLSLRGDRAHVVSLNDTCHLESLNLDPPGRRL